MEEPMKIKRCLLAVAVIMTAAAACSGDVTAPDPSFHAQQSGAALEEATTTSTTPTTIEPVQPDPGDTGSWGSGCCSNR
jgi:hypothetical protein